MRRAFFWTMIASVVVLPAWLLFGRALFGAPIGARMISIVLLGILLAITIGGVAGATIVRKEVRSTRSATWHDVRLVGPWLLGIVLLGLLVVDDGADGPGSALTAILGDGALTASATLFALLTIVTLAAAVVIIGIQTRLLLRETRARVSSYLDTVAVQGQRPIVKPATFERVDDSAIGSQRGQTIRIDPGDDQR